MNHHDTLAQRCEAMTNSNYLQELVHALLFAAVIALPFAIYFWNMK